MESTINSYNLSLATGLDMRNLKLQDLEEIRAMVDSRIREAHMQVVYSDEELTVEDESRIVKNSIADMLHSLMSFVDPRDVLKILSKLHEAPHLLDLLPRLVRSEDAMAKVLKDEAPLFI